MEGTGSAYVWYNQIISPMNHHWPDLERLGAGTTITQACAQVCDTNQRLEMMWSSGQKMSDQDESESGNYKENECRYPFLFI